MSERPFMQLYVSDFIGDTLHLSTEQIGAYMLLLMAMWNAGGKLPSDEAKLARVTRMSVKKWKAIADDLLPFFEIVGDEIRHNRLTKELQKSESKSQSRAAAGAAGGAAKALKEQEARLANAKRSSQHLPDTITREESSSLRSEDSSEPKKSPPTVRAVIELPATSNEIVPVTEEDIAEWRGAFPAVDVIQQLRSMRQWLIANPNRRKTKRGMRKFIVQWLSRRQDQGPPLIAGQPPPERRESITDVLKRQVLEMQNGCEAEESDGVGEADGFGSPVLRVASPPR